MKLLDGHIRRCPDCGAELSSLGTVFKEGQVEQTLHCKGDDCNFLATYKFRLVLDKVEKIERGKV